MSSARPVCCHFNLYGQREDPGNHAFLKMLYFADPEERIKCNLDAQGIVRLPWVSVGSIKIEFQTTSTYWRPGPLLAYVRPCVRERRVHQRIIMVVDPGVVKGAI